MGHAERERETDRQAGNADAGNREEHMWRPMPEEEKG